MLEFLDDNHFSSVFLLTGTQNVDTSNPYPGLEGLKIGVMDELDYRVQMSKVEELMYPYHYEEDFDVGLYKFLCTYHIQHVLKIFLRYHHSFFILVSGIPQCVPTIWLYLYVFLSISGSRDFGHRG